jgi:hypothetical protein
MAEKKPPTHTAFTLKRESRAVAGEWLEIGGAVLERGAGDTHHVYLDRLPIGGFSGHVVLTPVGTKPEEPGAQRPGSQSDGPEP